MTAFITILRKELRGFFLSPVAYVVISMMMIVQGVSFLFALKPLLTGPQNMSLVQAQFTGALFWIPLFVLFPLITMRLFSEEQKMGTLEMLLTAPVRMADVVLAKFFACLIFYIILWLPTILHYLLLEWIGGIEHAFPVYALAGAFCIIVLLGMMNIAIGCLASSLSANQIVAGVLTFALIVMLFLLGHLPGSSLGGLSEIVQEFFEHINSDLHMQRFSSGMVDTRPIAYYLSATAVLLVATTFTLNARRWKN